MFVLELVLRSFFSFQLRWLRTLYNDRVSANVGLLFSNGQIQTRDSGVGSTNATSGLCRPSIIRCVSWLVMIGSSGSLTWAFQLVRPANYRLLENHDNNCSDLTSAFPRLLTTPTTKTFGFKLPQFLFFLFLLKKGSRIVAFWIQRICQKSWFDLLEVCFG